VLGWPGSSGGRIDLVFPESFSLEPSEDWKAWMEAHASPGLLDSARRLGADARATAGPGPERDRLLLGLACETLRSSSPPALLLLHLSQAELPLALAGPGSPEAPAWSAACARPASPIRRPCWWPATTARSPYTAQRRPTWRFEKRG
jgi:hypothetical protein